MFWNLDSPRIETNLELASLACLFSTIASLTYRRSAPHPHFRFAHVSLTASMTTLQPHLAVSYGRGRTLLHRFSKPAQRNSGLFLNDIAGYFRYGPHPSWPGFTIRSISIVSVLRLPHAQRAPFVRFCAYRSLHCPSCLCDTPRTALR